MPEISLTPVPRPDGTVTAAPHLNVIFVHGLWGDPKGTWTYTKPKPKLQVSWRSLKSVFRRRSQSSQSDACFWPSWLTEDVEGVAAYTFGYPAAVTRLGSGWPVSEVAGAVLDRLVADPALQASPDAPIVFVCHSNGGLVVKKLMLMAETDREQDPRRGKLLDRVAGVAFLATPHGGSRTASRFSFVLPRLASDTMRGLRMNNAELLDLAVSYRTRFGGDKARVRHKIFYEKRRIVGLLKPVEAYSADPGLDARPVPVDRNHLDICKPRSRDNQVHVGMLDFLRNVVLGPREPSLPEKIADVHEGVAELLARTGGAFQHAAGPDMAEAAVRHPDIRPVPGFTGRDELLGALDGKLWRGDGKSTVAIHNATAVDSGRGQTSAAALAMRGLGGVGKTALAQHYAWEKRGRYHGIWWLRAEKYDTLVDDLVALGRRIGLRFGDDTEPEDASRQTLDHIAQGRTPKPWLLVYDNVEDKALVRRFTPPENAHVLYTTRLPGWRGEADELPVDVFPLETAITFLLAYDPPGETAETAGALAEALGRLPLALAHARAYAQERAWPFARYQERLAGLLDAMPEAPDSDYPNTVYVTFGMAIDRAAEKCPSAPRLMGLIAHYAPDQIPLWLIPESAMLEETRDEALAALRRLSLLADDTLADGTPGVSVHRLVQEVMRARLRYAGKAEQTAAVATRIIMKSYDDGGSFGATAKNTVWLPHASAILAHAHQEADSPLQRLRICNQISGFRSSRGEPVRKFYETRLRVGTMTFAVPECPEWQRVVSESLLRKADVQQTMGDVKGALANYQKSLTTFEALVAADPEYPEWQGSVSVSLIKIADVLRASGDTKAALANYQKSLAIREALSAADPEHLEWQRDVSISLDRIADVLRASGDTKAALANYQKSLAIREVLSAADPEHLEWQRDAAMSNERLGDIFARDGKPSEALAAFERALATYRALLKRNPDDLPSLVNSVVPLWRLGSLKGEDGATDLQTALSILKPLAEADRLDAKRRGWIRQIEVQIAAQAPDSLS